MKEKEKQWLEKKTKQKWPVKFENFKKMQNKRFKIERV